MVAAELPDRMVWDRYTLYKAGTKKIVCWLLETAASIGFGDPKFKPTGVATKKMLRCADAIVRQPQIHIPGSMVDLIDEVIRGRQAYAGLFSSRRQEGQKEDPSDISHQHFIEALQTIHHKLKEARKKQKAEKLGIRSANGIFATPPATPISPTKQSEGLSLPREQSLQSLFKHLAVDEPLAQPFTSPEREKKNQPEARELNKPTVAIDPIAESRFALVCFLEDMAEIHSFVRELWEDVVSGKVTADCAMQVTENAFGCMRRGTYTLFDIFRDLGVNDVNAHFLRLNAIATSMEDDEKTTVVIGDRLHWQLDKTHLLCIGATLIATTAINECDAYRKSKKKRGGIYEPSEMAKNLADVYPFAKALFKVIPDLYLLANPNNEFASLLYAYDGKHTMQVCTAMVTQSYMDIYDIVGHEKISGLLGEAMSKYVKQLEKEIACREDAVREVRYPASFGRPEALLETFITEKKFLNHLQSPNLEKAKTKVAAEARIGKTLPIGPWEQMKLSKWMMNQVSAALANDGWVNLALSYLYRASLYFGLLTTKWPDMEWFIRLQSQTRSYVLEVAGHADDAAWSRHWQIAFGVPPEYIRRINTNRITDGMRKVESQLLWPKLGEVLAQAEDVLGYERGDMAEEVMHQIADRVYAKDAKKHIRSQATYTAIELFTAFKKAAIHDEMELNFSYIEFWSTNAKLLHQIWKAVGPRIPDMLKELDVGTDSEIVNPLLKEAGLSVTCEQPLVGTQLALAARMIEKHIQAHGDEYAKKAREMSSDGAGEGTWSNRL